MKETIDILVVLCLVSFGLFTVSAGGCVLLFVCTYCKKGCAYCNKLLRKEV